MVNATGARDAAGARGLQERGGGGARRRHAPLRRRAAPVAHRRATPRQRRQGECVYVAG